MTKPLLVIANSESGTFINTVDKLKALLDKYDINHELITVNTFSQIQRATRKINPKKYAAVGVFGGDGTVVRVVNACAENSMPVMLLPGGSANSLALEVGSPGSLEYIIRHYSQREYVIRRTQLAECDGSPMVLDAHFGLFAEALEETPRQLKNIFGQFAYALTMVRKVIDPEPRKYRLEIDGVMIDTKGYVCFIVNHGRPRIMGQSLVPSFREGNLRIALIHKTTFGRVILWYVGRSLFHRNHPRVVLSKRAEKIVIHKAPNEYAFDDSTVSSPDFPLTFTVSSKTARILVPAPARHSWLSRLRVIQTNYYRFIDHARRMIGGTPNLRYSRIGKNLYLGGQYGRQAVPVFRAWNVTGIVSMREFIPKQIDDIDILHLPTVDHTPPTLEDLERGVAFIQQRLDNDESVYIHCRLGEGRGPSMAAAYLISTGMRAQDAIAHLQKTRPHARPNKKQVEQLMKFAERFGS